MKPLEHHDIEDLLTDLDPVDVPAGLAESIKAEIPADLTLPSTVNPTAPTPFLHRTWLGRRTWLPLAASLLTLVGGGYLAHRLLLTHPEPAAVMESFDTSSAERSGGARSDKEAPATELAAVESPDESLLRGVPEAGPRAKTDDALSRQQGLESLGYVDSPPVRGQSQEESLPYPQNLAEPPRIVPRIVPGERSQPVEGNEAIAGGELRQETAKSELRSRLRDLQEELDDRTRGAQESASAADQDTRALPPPPPPLSAARPAPARRPEAQRARPASPPLKRLAEETTTPTPRTSPPVDDIILSPSAPGNSRMERESPAFGTTAVASTGGTAEPNDAPFGDVFFKGYGTNPFVDTEDDRLSTFGLDVDTASYAVVRRYLNDGHLPPQDAVRVEELVNYFDYGDASPQKEEFALHAEGAPSPFATGDRYYLLRFNLRGREVAAKDRPPAMLTFVVDVSGSMNQENRLGLVKRALGLLLDELRDDDRISLVVYGSRARIVLQPTSNHASIRQAIMELRPGGSTNAEGGLRLAYEQAARHRQDGAIHRVILCSDGVANVGRTGAESILEQVQNEARKGIELTTVGFGMGNYNDVLMEQLADRGNGRYAYVDTLDEAHRIFVEDLTGTLMTLAAEARTQVEFNEEVVARYRLLGYENRDIADHRFRDDTIDAGEIGVGHTVTALYEIKLHKDLPRRRAADLEIATLRLRYGSVARREMVEQTRTVTGADLARSWEKASPALRLTSLVAEFAEILKGTYWAREGDLDIVFRRAQKVSAEFAGDRDVADFVSLVGRAAEYTKRR